MAQEGHRSADYYRQRAIDMRKEAARAESDDVSRLYIQAAKSFEELGRRAAEKKRAPR